MFFIQRFNLEASRAAVRVCETLVSPRDSSCTSGAAGFGAVQIGSRRNPLYQRDRVGKVGGGPRSPSLRACTAIQRHVHREAIVTVSCQSGCDEYIACAARRGLTRAVAVTQNTAGQTSESLQAVAPEACGFVLVWCAQWRRAMEGWPSGLRRTLGKRVYGKP